MKMFRFLSDFCFQFAYRFGHSFAFKGLSFCEKPKASGDLERPDLGATGGFLVRFAG